MSAAEVTSLAKSISEPITLTKNGYADLVVMSVETYKKQTAKDQLHNTLLERELDLQANSITYELSEIICNKYGKKTEVIYEGNHPVNLDYQSYANFSEEFGYASCFDGCKVSFDLCEDCFQVLLKTFVHPAKIEEFMS